MKKLVLATHNSGKVAELQTLLAPLGVEVISAADLNLPDVVEDADTFDGNALKKARAAHQASGLPALADDSGLCVDALDGAPGVFTARYGGWEKLLENMKTASTRSAHFHCTLALVMDTGETLFHGQCNGHISEQGRGVGGFGYDPVFIPEGETRTFAEMGTAQKHAFSHRGRAMKSLTDFLQARRSA